MISNLIGYSLFCLLVGGVAGLLGVFGLFLAFFLSTVILYPLWKWAYEH